jgi:hypothetical protein
MTRQAICFVILGVLVARAGEGGQPMTVRAVRLAEPLRIDGKLDEAVYTSERPMSDFIQNEPQVGAPATEKTEVWLTFDRDHVYVSARCWETRMERLIANEMRRDNNAIWNGNDMLAFMFDTFYDRRNAFQFNVNAIGGRSDGQVTNERQWNGDWNPIWEVKTGRFEGGWTVEAAIPFKSLRYRPGPSQTWGFNVLRANRWKNELSFLTPTPAGNGQQNLLKVSLSATVAGLEVPASSRNLEIKPYAISELTSDVNATPKISNNLTGDFGVDAKYGISQNMTANFTYNTDFAQVEADEQQVNLTRFSLFFPEKREFFLENQGTFSFGGVQTNNAGGDTPVLFYSRRIGLAEQDNQTFEVPIVAGGRLSGRLGRYSFGALNIQTNDDPASGARPTNFSVARVRRDLLRRSSIGLMLTGRSARQAGIGTNYAYGVDGAFAFFDNLAINTYWARTETEGLSGRNASYRAQLDYTGDRYGLQLEHLLVGDHFNPEVGFVRRDDMRRTFGQVRFSPRPQSIESIRKFSGIGSLNYIENGAGRLETRDWNGEFGIEFQNSDKFTASQGGSFEYLSQPFRVAPGIAVPIGSYDSATTRVGFTMGRQRKISSSVTAEYGTFYSGHKTTVGVSQGRMNLTAQLSAEPSYSVNHVDLPQGTFTTHLAGMRVTYTMTPLMFVSALLQYNSSIDAVTTNMRLRWEYQPGSELFVVYNEQRDTRALRFPALANRAIVVKINRLFRP